MPQISQRAVQMPASPIRKLVPLAEAAAARGTKIYHLNIGQPDLPTPEVGLQALKHIDRKVLEYSPSDGYRSLREKLVSYYEQYQIKLTPDEIIVTAGGSEAVLFAFMTCLNPGDEIIVPEPAYANYMAFAISAGAVIRPVVASIENGFALPPIEEFEKHQFDLVVLDLMLPKIPGERVCRTIRDTSDVPIIMLTAKGEIEDRIIGLELGADDYLIKPFSPRELVARVRALFRRAHQADEPAVEVLDFGDLVIDISGHKILVEGKEVDLTASEFKLLTTLARHPGRVYNRMELVEKVLGYDFEGYERTIDSHVKNLRAKLGDDPKKPKWLYTVHGVGYRFEAPAKTDKSDEK